MTRRIFVSITLVSLLGATNAAQQADVSLETNVKAAFVFQFSRYVDWPERAFSSRSDPFRVCTIAEPEFTRALDKVLAGETAAGRRMTRSSPESAQEARQCQILYIARDDWPRGQSLIAAVQNSPVLTIGDAPEFLISGGQILLVRDENRIRFDVNLTAVQMSGVNLRSQLLRIARKVVPKGGGRQQ